MEAKPLSTLQSWIDCRVLPRDGGSNCPSELFCQDRLGHIATCIMDELLVWGGYFGRRLGYIYCENDEVWSYNLEMDLWFRYKPKGKAPEFTTGATSAVVWPYWYVFCGHCKDGYTDFMYRLNLQTCTWEFVKPKGNTITPRDKLASWVYESRIYIFGGYGPVTYMYLWDNETDVFTPEVWHPLKAWNNQVVSFDVITKSWGLVKTKGPRPIGRAAHTAVRVDNAVYIFGGRNLGERMNDLHCLDLLNFTWSGPLKCKGELPQGRSWHSMTRLGKENLVLMGGFNTEEQILDDLWLLNVKSLSWSMLKLHTGHPRLWHTAGTLTSGDLLIFGGCTNNILDSTVPLETSNHVLTVRLGPYPLERLCLHVLWKNRFLNWKTWSSLPSTVRSWLERRRKAHEILDMQNFACCATAIYGPSLRQLSVMQPEQVEMILCHMEKKGRESDQRPLEDCISWS